MLVPKLIPIKIGTFGPKSAEIGPNIGIFGPFDLIPDQKTMRTSCLGGFLTKSADFVSMPAVQCSADLRSWHRYLAGGSKMQAYLVPCQWVGWWLWRAGCISQDTYLLYCILIQEEVRLKVRDVTEERTLS